MATLKEKIQLLRSLVGGEAAYNAPFYVQINPTNVCNLQCFGCVYHSSQMRGVSPTIGNETYMPLRLVERLCEELPAMGTREVTICGEGEPLLHPHWLEMVTAFKRAGLHVELFTNGTLLDSSASAGLLAAGLDVLYVSLWATSQEEYAKCYPGTDPDNLRRTLEGIRLVSGLKAKHHSPLPAVVLAGPFHRHNYRGIDRRIALAHELGCDGIRFSPFVDSTGEFASATIPGEEIETLSEELANSRMLLESYSLGHNLDEALRRFGFGREVWNHVPCYIGWLHSHISFDGQVKPCGSCPIPLGNLNESSFEEVWNGPGYRAFRAKALTVAGQAALHHQCDCHWCCHAKDSYKVQRYMRWIAPLLGRPA